MTHSSHGVSLNGRVNRRSISEAGARRPCRIHRWPQSPDAPIWSDWVRIEMANREIVQHLDRRILERGKRARDGRPGTDARFHVRLDLFAAAAKPSVWFRARPCGAPVCRWAPSGRAQSGRGATRRRRGLCAVRDGCGLMQRIDNHAFRHSAMLATIEGPPDPKRKSSRIWLDCGLYHSSLPVTTISRSYVACIPARIRHLS